MRGSLGDGKGVRLLTIPLPKGVPLPHVNRSHTLQIRQPESLAAVATVGGAQERKQSLVGLNGHKGPVAKRPTLWWKTETENSDLSYEWFSHRDLLLVMNPFTLRR
jgi:hypothetical protein